MNAVIFLSSFHHQNTQKIARQIAKVLKAKILKPQHYSDQLIKDNDLIGFGSGIYFGKFHRHMLELLKKLEPVNAKKAFVFSTSGAGLKIYNRAVIWVLKKKGFHLLKDFACRGFDTYGPYKLIGGIAKGHPDNLDLAKASAFAHNLVVD